MNNAQEPVLHHFSTVFHIQGQAHDMFSRIFPNTNLQFFLTNNHVCNICVYFFLWRQNLTWNCSLIYVFFPEFTWAEPEIVLNSRREQFLYRTCSPHVLQKEELLKKIYLYESTNFFYQYFLKWSKLRTNAFFDK